MIIKRKKNVNVLLIVILTISLVIYGLNFNIKSGYCADLPQTSFDGEYASNNSTTGASIKITVVADPDNSDALTALEIKGTVGTNGELPVLIGNGTNLPWYAYTGTSSITKITFTGCTIVAPTSCEKLFVDMKGLKSIDVSNLDTSNVTNMFHMFAGCTSLTTLDISNFTIGQNLTSMRSMFSGSKNLSSISFPSVMDTSKVTDMVSMFNNTGFTTLDLSKFDTSSVTDASCMFYNTENPILETIIFGDKFNLSKANTSNFFYNCKNLKTIVYGKADEGSNTLTINNTILSLLISPTTLQNITFNNVNFDSTITTLNSKFKDRTKLQTVIFNNVSASNVTDMESMFNGCTSLETANLTFTALDNTTGVTMTNLFYGCDSLKNVTLKMSDSSEKIKVKNTTQMFQGCSSLESLDLSYLDTSEVTSMCARFLFAAV